MKKRDYKSIELLDKFITDTPSSELAALIAKYDKLDIKGPTFDEYLYILKTDFNKF